MFNVDVKADHTKDWLSESGRKEIKKALQELQMLLEEPTGGFSSRLDSAIDIRAVRRARSLRDRFFNPRLFGDPAWDMLLDLYEAELSQSKVSVTSLAHGSAIPCTTALRWMNALISEGLVERRDDPLDGRRSFVSLSARGSEAMRDYFASLPASVYPL
jgi:DNA-binding MarR family transcriptional regulator